MIVWSGASEAAAAPRHPIERRAVTTSTRGRPGTSETLVPHARQCRSRGLRPTRTLRAASELLMTTRRLFFQIGAAGGAALFLPWAQSPVASAMTGRGLQKFLQRLPLPGAGLVVATPSGTNRYSFSQIPLARQLHPQLLPTPIWAYDDGTGARRPGWLVRHAGTRAERHTN